MRTESAIVKPFHFWDVALEAISAAQALRTLSGWAVDIYQFFRNRQRPTAHAVDAGAVNVHFEVSEPSVTVVRVKRASNPSPDWL